MYPPIFPPEDIPEKRAELKKRHLRQYFAWFQSVVPERVAILEKEVRSTSVGTGWKADCSRDSLRQLDEWFVSTALIQRRDKPEPVILNGRQIATVDYELAGETYVRSFDSGVYFGEVLIKGNTGFRWDMLFNTTIRNDNFGHPLVRGLGQIPCNPVRLFVVIAHKKAKGEIEQGGLLRLHGVWTDLLLGKPFVEK